MGLFEHFPYTNFHDLNLDVILKRVKDAETAAQESAEDAASSAENAASSASAAIASANSAAASAEIAQGLEDQITAASNTADQALTDAATAIAAVNNSITPEIISSSDWIDSENTTITIIDQYGVRIGNLFFFRIYFRASEGHRTLYFKDPYNGFLAPLPFAVYTRSTASSPYDTFEQLVMASVSHYISFPNFTANDACISGILLLNAVQ